MRIGIIICDRYNTCSGGKCFRSVYNREGAFQRYSNEEKLEVVAYTSCGGCPGGNVEQVVMDMKNYGAEAIHFATGVLAGYPPCKQLSVFKRFSEEKTQLPIIIGTHPMPTNYITMHEKLNDWTKRHYDWMKEFNLLDPAEAVKYDSSLDGYSSALKEEVYK